MGHVMNLVVQDVAHNIPECWNFMSLIQDLITLISNSPKRLAWFQDFQSADRPSLRPLCPTRWTVKAASLQSISSNYSALLEFLDNLSSDDKGDAGGKANGLLQAPAEVQYILFTEADVDVFSLCRNNQSHAAT